MGARPPLWCLRIRPNERADHVRNLASVLLLWRDDPPRPPEGATAVNCPSCGGSLGAPPVTPAGPKWYYARDKQKVGPLYPEQLRRLAATGQLRPVDMVWQEGTPKWLTAGMVAGLFP